MRSKALAFVVLHWLQDQLVDQQKLRVLITTSADFLCLQVTMTARGLACLIQVTLFECMPMQAYACLFCGGL